MDCNVRNDLSSLLVSLPAHPANDRSIDRAFTDARRNEAQLLVRQSNRPCGYHQRRGSATMIVHDGETLHVRALYNVSHLFNASQKRRQPGNVDKSTQSCCSNAAWHDVATFSNGLAVMHVNLQSRLTDCFTASAAIV